MRLIRQAVNPHVRLMLYEMHDGTFEVTLHIHGNMAATSCHVNWAEADDRFDDLRTKLPTWLTHEED